MDEVNDYQRIQGEPQTSMILLGELLGQIPNDAQVQGPAMEGLRDARCQVHVTSIWACLFNLISKSCSLYCDVVNIVGRCTHIPRLARALSGAHPRLRRGFRHLGYNKL